MTISNQLNLDQNLKLFFLRFSKAVESKNKNLLYQLISDNYYSNSLMNQNKQDLINFLITSLAVGWTISSILDVVSIFE